ncbi:YceI family protein [Arthrobacter oryzae]|jgi:polyisoprenoid-binding protein YceI|uniref:YceI family protein n=1 Tax=Arthrobacter oryzae TaxID=409290 RepID=UPI0027836B48|nr:YceI family protein [Arthrobacter oryzae]MDQ0078953.1 polyisoprenoid-binding protein YceI [Arthrobacter oryzae]
MTTQPATKTPSMPTAGTYRIDGVRSRVTYTSRHMFGLGKVRAEFSIASGRLDIAESLSECRAMATIDAASFKSDNAKRDRDVKGPGLLDVADFPRIEFTSTAVREDKRGMVLVGTVSMHGVVAPVQLPVSSWEAQNPDRIQVLARAGHLDRYSFGITGAKGWVGRYFDLDFEVVVVRAAGN